MHQHPGATVLTPATGTFPNITSATVNIQLLLCVPKVRMRYSKGLQRATTGLSLQNMESFICKRVLPPVARNGVVLPGQIISPKAGSIL